MTKGFPRGRTVAGGVVAGLIGGCLVVICIVVMTAVVMHVGGLRLAGFFAFDASALVGKVAYTGGGYVALGVALHFLVAVGWALGYAVLAERLPQLVTRPILSGAMFGLLVYFAMQLVLVGANLYHTPTPRELFVLLLGHLVFYGIPVALIVARTQRTA